MNSCEFQDAQLHKLLKGSAGWGLNPKKNIYIISKAQGTLRQWRGPKSWKLSWGTVSSRLFKKKKSLWSWAHNYNYPYWVTEDKPKSGMDGRRGLMETYPLLLTIGYWQILRERKSFASDLFPHCWPDQTLMDIPESLNPCSRITLSVSPKHRGREGLRQIFRAEGAQQTWVERRWERVRLKMVSMHSAHAQTSKNIVLQFLCIYLLIMCFN